MSAQPSKRKQKLRRPVYGTVERVMRPDTGEIILALVASMPVDKRALKEKGLRAGDEVRMEITKPRNPYFWRKAHVLGAWLAANVEPFAGLTQHAAVKRLQELSGVGCEVIEYDLPGIGKLTRSEPQSLDFESMDETEFTALWDGGDVMHHEGGWLGWLRREQWGFLPAALIADVEALLEKPE